MSVAVVFLLVFFGVIQIILWAILFGTVSTASTEDSKRFHLILHEINRLQRELEQLSPGKTSNRPASPSPLGEPGGSISTTGSKATALAPPPISPQPVRPATSPPHAPLHTPPNTPRQASTDASFPSSPPPRPPQVTPPQSPNRGQQPSSTPSGPVKTAPPPAAACRTTPTAPPLRSSTPQSPSREARKPIDLEPSELGMQLNRFWSWFTVGEEHRPKNVSLEYAVATTWLIRGAVLTLLAALCFFLRWAYVRNLISPEMRVGVTVLFGAALLGLGTKLLKGNYRAIGVGLIGVGFGSFYFAIYSAFHLYHLCSPVAAILVSFLITAGAVLFALWRNLLPVALIGIVCGYAAPLVFNSGVKNFPGLFSYILLLGLGVAFLQWRRDWKLVAYLSFLGTYVLYGLAMNRYYATTDYPICIVFLGIFFLMFTAMLLIHPLPLRQAVPASAVVMVILNVLIVSSAGIWITADSFSMKAASAVPFVICALYIPLSIWLDRTQRRAEALSTACFVLGIAAALLGCGLLCNDEFLTIVWCSMAVALFGAANRSGFPILLRAMGGLAYFVAFVHFLTCLGQFFIGETVYSAHLTERILSAGVLIASAALIAWFCRRDQRESMTAPSQAVFFTVVTLGGLWIWGTYEINLGLGLQEPTARAGAISVWWGVFALALLWRGIVSRVSPMRHAALLLFAVTIGKVFLFDLASLDQIYRIVASAVLALALLGGAFAYIRFREKFTEGVPSHPAPGPTSPPSGKIPPC